jgi:hypothetical protein
MALERATRLKKTRAMRIEDLRKAFQTEPDFEPLRARPDFQAFLASLSEKPQP